MLVRRILALALAVGLVVGALQLRQRLFGAAPPDVPSDLQLVCVQELADVCALVPGIASPIIEDAATTVERFANRDPGLDVWLTLQPWPQFAADARQRATQPALDARSSQVLGRSRVLLAAWEPRIAVLEADCGGTLTWRCIGQRADQPWAQLGGEAGWGRVKVGLDDPSTSAAGLLELAQATASYFDGPFNSRLLEDPDFFAWLSLLAEAAGDTGQPPVERMLLTGSADYEFAGTLESFAAPLLRRSSDRGAQIQLRDVGPALTADVVAVGYGTDARAVDGVTEQVRAALADTGWRVPGAETPSELEPVDLPSDNGLPTHQALQALRATWAEVAGSGA